MVQRNSISPCEGAFTKKIAYLILAHTDPVHLARLTNTIDYNSKIFIHLDKKSNLLEFKDQNYPENALFIKDRVRISWAGFSMITATLNLIKAAVNSGEDFSHFVLISGLDYPIKSPQVISDFLNKNQNKQIIRFIDMRDSYDHHMNHINQYWFQDEVCYFLPGKVDGTLRKMLRLLFGKLRKKPLKKSIPAFGSQWWALTPECAKYTLKFLSEYPEFSRFYKTAFSPDEQFFHTIVANSPYLDCSTGFQKYSGRGTYKQANLHIIHHSLTKYYDENDFDEIQQSDYFFVRKVSSAKSSQLLDKIDQNLLSTQEQNS